MLVSAILQITSARSSVKYISRPEYLGLNFTDAGACLTDIGIVQNKVATWKKGEISILKMPSIFDDFKKVADSCGVASGLKLKLIIRCVASITAAVHFIRNEMTCNKLTIWDKCIVNGEIFTLSSKLVDVRNQCTKVASE